jgi:hypothetical protein
MIAQVPEPPAVFPGVEIVEDANNNHRSPTPWAKQWRRAPNLSDHIEQHGSIHSQWLQSF